MTLKALNYVSQMRSNLSLMRRSKQVTAADFVDCRSEVVSFLEQRVLIYPPAMRRLGLSPDMSFIERKKALGLSSTVEPATPEEIQFQEFFESKGRQALKSNWMWRVGREAEDMRDRGWYPFFCTLTLDVHKVPDTEEFWRDGRGLGRWLHNLARVSARACGQIKAFKSGASDHLFVRHFGVVEHGSSGEHHHMHVLIWMRGIPEDWKQCPNRGVADPSRRWHQECWQMRRYWPHSLAGLSPCLYFRSQGDVWGFLGFAHPILKGTGKPLRILPAGRAGTYVAKYMEKEDKSWNHRAKATRDLGMGRLRNLLHSLPMQTVEALSWRPRRYQLSILVQTMQSVPLGLLRSLAKQVAFCKKWAEPQLDLRNLTLPSCAPFVAMRESVRDGARPSRMSSEALFDWVTSHLPVPEGYCEKRLGRAFCKLMVDFPPDRRCADVSSLGGMRHA